MHTNTNAEVFEQLVMYLLSYSRPKSRKWKSISCLSQQIQQYPRYSGQQRTKVSVQPHDQLLKTNKHGFFALFVFSTRKKKKKITGAPWNIVENKFMQEVCGRWGFWIFLVCWKQTSGQNCSSFLLDPVFGHDETWSWEGSEPSAFYRLQPGEKKTELLPPTATKIAFGERERSKKQTNKKFQVSRREKQKNCWHRHCRPAPAPEADGGSSRKKKLKKAAWCNRTRSNISSMSGKEMHILCRLSSLNMPQSLMQGQAG